MIMSTRPFAISPAAHRTARIAARLGRPAILALAIAAPAHAADPLKDAVIQETKMAMAAVALATDPKGLQYMQQAFAQLPLEASFKFLDKSYENDQYTNVAGQKIRTSCVRFRATSGFGFAMQPPAFQLTTAGLRVDQKFNKIDANDLTVKIQLGPCADVA